MDTSRLKKFAQYARRSLIDQVESSLKLVLAAESEARREYPQAVAKLEKKLTEQSVEKLIEQVAYIWFNRFCALRFMDVNQYNRIMVISPLAGQFQPEILAEAKAGHIDEGIVNKSTQDKVFGLLRGSVASRDGQSEAFRLLIVAVCNDLHRIMPYLFERIEDYTELLMPDDLLSGNSILAYTREAMTPEACESVESIGWLYQFYISEKKDKVFADLKKNVKITPENIPAATQLFTPHWIVRYLVENSLGRLWMLNNPNSKVIEQMDYYIKPVEEEADFLRVSGPEEIKICDPACGSGHMLTYAYDLLYVIYLDAGYDSTGIPENILSNNLYGIEIDERAAELAAFALTMKAVKGNPLDDSNNRRRFFRNPVEPNICRLEKVAFTDEELDSYIDFTGKDLFTQDLRATLKEFEEADNFGSLIQPTLKTPADALTALEAKDVSGQLFLSKTHKSVLKVLKQADYLSQKYHVVVANPPYMGGKGMNGRLSKWAKENYAESKFDLFSMFIERDLKLSVESGYSAMINMQSWMFLSSFESLRNKLLEQSTITSMAHLGTKAFDTIGGEVVSTTAYVLLSKKSSLLRGDYFRLVDGKSEKEKDELFLSVVKGCSGEYRFHAATEYFNKVPGNPIAYWFSDQAIRNCDVYPALGEYSEAKSGMSSCNSEKFLRQWYEVSYDNLVVGATSHDVASESGKRWFPYNKGGGDRRWYGYNETVINWKNDGEDLKTFVVNNPKDPNTTHWSRRLFNLECFFKNGVTWSAVSSGMFSCRVVGEGVIPGTGSKTLYGLPQGLSSVIFALLNSSVSSYYLGVFSPTLNFEAGDVAKIPVIENIDIPNHIIKRLVEISRNDWSSEESSIGYLSSPLFHRGDNFKLCLESLRSNCLDFIDEMLGLEERLNKLFVDAYGLGGDVSAEVDINKVSLRCNPSYRYSGKREQSELVANWYADTIREFLSYSVGCMFGRYSLDKEGLILANHGDTLEHYLKQAPNPSFMPDEDNVIPLIDFDGDWFEDDITERFKQFLKVTFGEEHFSENLTYIEEAIGKDIKKFFLKDFYADHVKRYKKRPIYWMFSSPKGSFNALIYMHRYRPDTVSVVLNDYLREFRTKLQARKESHEQIEISASASAKEKTQAIKAIQKINKVLDEVNDYERDVLYPLAGKNIEIDLDDGVKHNYPLFGKALKKITGLS